MDQTTKLLVEQRCHELERIAKQFANQQGFLGSDLDEAILGAMEYYFDHPTSKQRPESIFRVYLRRELASRLKFGDKKELLKVRSRYAPHRPARSQFRHR